LCIHSTSSFAQPATSPEISPSRSDETAPTTSASRYSEQKSGPRVAGTVVVVVEVVVDVVEVVVDVVEVVVAAIGRVVVEVGAAVEVTARLVEVGPVLVAAVSEHPATTRTAARASSRSVEGRDLGDIEPPEGERPVRQTSGTTEASAMAGPRTSGEAPGAAEGPRSTNRSWILESIHTVDLVREY